MLGRRSAGNPAGFGVVGDGPSERRDVAGVLGRELHDHQIDAGVFDLAEAILDRVPVHHDEQQVVGRERDQSARVHGKKTSTETIGHSSGHTPQATRPR